jgi:hypothetical protein
MYLKYKRCKEMKNKISGQSLKVEKGNFNKYEQNEQIFLYLAHLFSLILVVCFDKIYIALFEGSGSVQIY